MRSDEIPASVEREFVGVASPTMPRAPHGSSPGHGLYWRPRGGRPRVAFIATHYNVDYAEHYLAPYFAERGYGFLGWNTRYQGAEDLFQLEHGLIDIGAGVRWLREQAAVERVVILGNSGGASLMGAYQAQAVELDLEASGVTGEALQQLEPGALFVSVNSHPGRSVVLTNWLDPSVTDELDPLATDPLLDAFAPENGPPYDSAFQTRYRAAQRERNHRITRWARDELARLSAAGIPDRIFGLFRSGADLRFMDPEIDPSQRRCPACYAGDPARANRGFLGLGRANTLRAWLSMWSLEDSLARVDLQLPRVTQPGLVVQGSEDTGCFPSDARAIHAALGSSDKQLETIPGAHYFEGDGSDRVRVADLVAAWVADRT